MVNDTIITGDNNGSDGILCNNDVARHTQQSNRAKERGGERKSQGGSGIYIDMLSMYGRARQSL